MRAHAKRTLTSSALLALLEEGPIRRADLQVALGVGDFAFNRALATCRIYGFVELRAGLVSASEKGLELLADNRKLIEAEA